MRIAFERRKQKMWNARVSSLTFCCRPLAPRIVSRILIITVFLGPGITMKVAALWGGIKHWRLALVAQSLSLLFSPLAMYAVTWLLFKMGGTLLCTVRPTVVVCIR